MARQTYRGSCHCGAVQFAVAADLEARERLFGCNCSRCRRLAAVMGSAPASDFSLEAGQEHLKIYRFNHQAIDHQFCTTCGVQAFSRGRNGETEMVVFNVGCLEGAPMIERSGITHFNGADY